MLAVVIIWGVEIAANRYHGVVPFFFCHGV